MRPGEGPGKCASWSAGTAFSSGFRRAGPAGPTATAASGDGKGRRPADAVDEEPGATRSGERAGPRRPELVVEPPASRRGVAVVAEIRVARGIDRREDRRGRIERYFIVSTSGWRTPIRLTATESPKSRRKTAGGKRPAARRRAPPDGNERKKKPRPQPNVPSHATRLPTTRGRPAKPRRRSPRSGFSGRGSGSRRAKEEPVGSRETAPCSARSSGARAVERRMAEALPTYDAKGRPNRDDLEDEPETANGASRRSPRRHGRAAGCRAPMATRR